MAFPLTNMDMIQHHRSYDPKLFVNRQPEIEKVQKRVRLAQSERTVSDSIINYWGVRGIGKTWILRHLEHKFSYHVPSQEKHPSFTLFFEFQENELIEKFVNNLANQIISQLSTDAPQLVRKKLEGTQITGNLEELAEGILELSKKFTPLILLDNTEQVSTELWEQIEKLFFEPIVSTGRVLVILAGRRQIPRWRRFEVRRRLMESDKSQIRPFDKEDVLKQVENRKVSIPVELLYPYTAGNPHLVDALVQYIQEQTRGSGKPRIDKSWINHHKQGILEVLQVIEKELTKGVSQRLKQPLLAVAPLRFYRLEAMRYMLAMQKPEFEAQPDSLFLQFLRDLDQETEIVWWDRGRRAYVTSEVVRRLLNRVRYLEATQEYISAHSHALRMYSQWMSESPKTSDEFIIEILFHHASICELKKDVQCLREETAKALEFARDNLNTERILVLQKQIEGDSELLELYSDELREELLDTVENLLNSRVE